MGPRPEPGADAGPVVVYERALGSNVVDVDGNRYIDLAAGFGSMLLGHQPQGVVDAIALQSRQLMQSLGDVHPSEVKVELLEQLAQLHPSGQGSSILGQSGADAIAAALKTAVLHTGRTGVIAFEGAYHGLGYGALSVCGLRQSYRLPFAAQLNEHVQFVQYPETKQQLQRVLLEVKQALCTGQVGAVIFEPIAGRAGCLMPAEGFAQQLKILTSQFGALLIADEIWTGLGRSGKWLFSAAGGCTADLVCLGKGLGGGLPLSVCVGSQEVMASWSREQEVVHTSTFAGAPLAAASALALLAELKKGQWVSRAERVGQRWLLQLRKALQSVASVRAVRGAGLMVGIELSGTHARKIQQMLLAAGYLVSLGGGARESLILTPALNISEQHLDDFTTALCLSCEPLS